MSVPRFVSIELPDELSFDEFVEYGKANGGNIVNGMPWSFDYKGYTVSHENDDCYTIMAPRGKMILLKQVKGDVRLNECLFFRGDTLVMNKAGELVVVSQT